MLGLCAPVAVGFLPVWSFLLVLASDAGRWRPPPLLGRSWRTTARMGSGRSSLNKLDLVGCAGLGLLAFTRGNPYYNPRLGAAMEGGTATQETAAEEKENPSSALSVRSTGDYTIGSIHTVLYVPDFISQTEQSQLLHHIYQAPAPKWKTLKNRRLQNWGGVVHEKGLLPQALPSWLTKITDRICEWTGLFPSAINHVLINEYHPNQGIMPHQDGPAYFPVVAIISLASPVVIDFSPHGKLRGHAHTYPQTVQSDELQESNGSGKVEGSKEADPASLSLLLMPCSLLIFKDQAYTDFLHGIQDNELHSLDKVANISQCPQFKHLSSDYSQGKADCPADSELTGTFHRTTTRVSLTCRLVLKVHNKLFKF